MTPKHLFKYSRNRTEAIIDTIPGSLKDALDHLFITVCRQFRGDIVRNHVNS